MISQKMRNIVIELILWILLLIAVSWAFFPVIYAIISSFKMPLNIWDYPPRFSGPYYSLINYQDLITKWPDYFKNIRNSLIITAGTVGVVIACSILGAYAFSRFTHGLVRMSALFIIAIRMVPPMVISIPLFPLFNSWGLIDKHITLIILYAAFMVSMTTLLMKTFVDDVPVALEEAAMIDGCSRLQAFLKVTIPLSAPGVVAVIIFTSIFAWNEYLFAFVFAGRRSATAPLILSEFMGAIMGVQWGMLLAATVIHLIPMVVLTWMVQSYLIKGMRFGAIK